MRTNLWCHECRNDFSVDLDYTLNGQHTVYCPHCAHPHYRVVQNGVVTEARWASSQGLPNYAYYVGTGSGSIAGPSFGNVYTTTGTTSANVAPAMYSWIAASGRQVM